MFLIILSKAFRNLMLPGVQRIFFTTLLAYIAAWGALAWIISAVISTYVGVHGAQGIIMHILASFGGIGIAWFFFPLLYPLLISFFDDKVADIIEHSDYPQLPPTKGPFWPTLLNDAGFSAKAVTLNTLCLPFYMIPLVGMAVYYGMNGYLLGTQFFRMIAGRRITIAEAATLQEKSHRSILLIGIAISFFSTVPLLNLAAPLIEIAAMLHLFHALRNTPRQEILPPA